MLKKGLIPNVNLAKLASFAAGFFFLVPFFVLFLVGIFAQDRASPISLLLIDFLDDGPLDGSEPANRNVAHNLNKCVLRLKQIRLAYLDAFVVKRAREDVAGIYILGFFLELFLRYLPLVLEILFVSCDAHA